MQPLEEAEKLLQDTPLKDDSEAPEPLEPQLTHEPPRLFAEISRNAAGSDQIVIGQVQVQHVEPLSEGALDRRMRRICQPDAKGAYKVSEEIRNMWNSGSKDKLFRLFAQCGNDPKAFVKRFAAKKTQEKESELGVYFAYKTAAELEKLPENLACMKGFKT